MILDDWGEKSSRWAGIRSDVISVRGYRVHLLRAEAAPSAPPDAPVQVLLHGMSGGGLFMLDLIAPLTAYGPVIAPDLPGTIFATTETPMPRAARPEVNARFVRAFIDELGLDRVRLHGLSMGSAVGMRFAAAHPERVVGAVLGCPPLPVPLGRAEQLMWATLGRGVLAAAPVLARGVMRFVGPRLVAAKLKPEALVATGGSMGFPEDTLAVWAEAIEEVAEHPQTLAHAVTVFAAITESVCVHRAETWAVVDAVRAPVLLFSGDADPLVPPEVIAAVLERRPDWSSHVAHGAGHAAPVERPQEYVQAVGRWLGL